MSVDELKIAGRPAMSSNSQTSHGTDRSVSCQPLAATQARDAQSRIATAAFAFLVVLLVIATSAFGQTPAPEQVADLSVTQQQVFRDYERFEKSLFDVAEQMRRKDPDRAELLYRARSQSQEQNILREMQMISDLLKPVESGSGQFGPAADRQKELLARLEAVLKLLQSLDERERIAAERERIEALLQENMKLLAKQKDARADTLRGRKADEELQSQQEKVLVDADTLAQKIDQYDSENLDQRSPPSASQGENEESPNKPGTPSQDTPGNQNNESSPSSENSREGEPSDSQQPSDSSGSPSDSSSESGQQNPMQSDGSQESNPSGGNPPSDSSPSAEPSPQSGQQEQPQQGTAGREQLEQAREQMQQAIEQLKEQQKDSAAEKQDEAINALEEMRAQLEEILRQLREEEKGSYLTLLEARLQGMLKRQQKINSDTIRVSGIEQEKRAQQNYASQTDTIRKDQEDNVLEAAKALSLLKEEGSSIAFPEAVQLMHQNMRLVSSRLSRQETGELTQGVQKLVVESLEEMIASLRNELEKQEQQSGSMPGQGAQGMPMDPGLVDQLSELRLIRSMENQVRTITRAIGTETDGESVAPTERDQILQDLRIRQQRIKDATYDLSIGRNQ